MRRKPSWLVFVAREPLFQFLLMGLLLWGAVDYWPSREHRYDIHVSGEEQRRIAAEYARQFGEPPTAQQFQQIVDRYVREEIFLREGLALGLDNDDEIVRRRIVQKFEFLRADLADPGTPSDAQLRRWYETEQRRYRTPERNALRQLYFATDRDGEEAARLRALRTLNSLKSAASRGAEEGDPFPGPAVSGELSEAEAQRLFGESAMTRTLSALPLGVWSGPFRSGYGWHLVLVTGRLPPVLPAFDEVREQVLADYLDEQRRRLNAANFDALRRRYRVQIDTPP